MKRLTENEFSVERWTEKVQTASAAKKAVNDYLFTNLPYPTYDEKEIADRTQVLYEFFRHDIGILGGRRDDH